MKIISYSDLHLEFGTDFKPPADNDADVMILAGDIITFRDYKPLTRFLSDWHKPVLFVAGNHEYYTNTAMNKENKRFKEWLATKHPNVTFLQDEAIIIDGVHFFGGTMWTDFDNSSLWYMQVAEQRMNDYRMIKTTKQSFLRAKDTIGFHKHFKANLLEWFAKSLIGPRVVISHHVPIQSTDPIHRESKTRPAYISLDMEAVIMQHQPDLWIYGHSHDPDDRMTDKTRVISNPRGYDTNGGDFLCQGFDEHGLPITV